MEREGGRVWDGDGQKEKRGVPMEWDERRGGREVETGRDGLGEGGGGCERACLRVLARARACVCAVTGIESLARPRSRSGPGRGVTVGAGSLVRVGTWGA